MTENWGNDKMVVISPPETVIRAGEATLKTGESR